MAKQILFVIYPGFELLDLSGPMSVFSTANALRGEDIYQSLVCSGLGGPVRSGAGVEVLSRPIHSVAIDQTSTVLVVGADEQPLQRANCDRALIGWLSDNCGSAERFGSVCSGTFLLHAAGLLSGKTVTTHWAGCRMLQAIAQDVSVLQDALYHIDGTCWTSAGVTTGIDMALEMIKRDHGEALMGSIAKRLVVYSQRPGKQSQFRQMQDLKPNQEDDFSRLVLWLKEQVCVPLKISDMAQFMCMSERSFQRRFSQHFGMSPSRFFERMRMEFARDFLLPKHAVECTARELGYRSVAAFRTAFEKHFGVSPSFSQLLR